MLVPALATGGALAAGPTERPQTFNIPAKPLGDALIDLGLQARVTLGGTLNCHGRNRPLVGTYTLREALDRLLQGSNCRYEMADAGAVRILPARKAAKPPAAKPDPAPTVATPATPVAVEELIVSTNRRPARVGSVAGGVSVISGADLFETGANGATDLGRRVAGFVTTNLGAGRDKILLRGLSDGAFTGRTQSTVGTYLDDIPLTHNAPDPDLKLVDIEQVEVLRGPQGAMYGGGSLSGVYRIVGRKPDLNSFSAQATVLGAVTESGSPSSQVQAIVNLPLVSDRAALRVSAYSDVDGGYIDDVNLRQSNVDRTKRNGGRAALALRLTDEWTVTLGGALQSLGSNDTQYVTPGPTGKLRRANQVSEAHDNDLSVATVTVSGVGDWGRLTSSTAFIKHNYASRYDATAAVSAFSDGAVEVGVYDESARVQRLVEDVVWSSPERGRLHWLLGGFFSSSRESGASDLFARSGSAPPRLVYQEDRLDRLRETAIYGEVSYNLGDGWMASVGARAFRTDVSVASDVFAPSPGRSRVFGGKDSFQGVSPKISIQKTFASGTLIYALASEGYRAGGFNTAGLTAPPVRQRAFQPDHLRNYEIGASLAPFGGKVRLRTALFYDRWTDIQTDQYYASGLSYTANVGDGRNFGLEAEASWKVTPRLTLQANGLLNSPKLTHADPQFAAADTSALPGVPDISAGLAANWRQPLTPDFDLLLTGEAGYVGRSRLTFDQRYSPSMGGYIASKLSAQLVTRHWRAALFLWNPTNAAGDTFAYGNPFSFGQVRQVTPLRPRTWSLALTADF